MRLPHIFFSVINPTVKMLLRSPLHGLWSHNLMLITFTGRKSGRTYTTPVRYLETAGRIHCFTAATNTWWRNLRGGAPVVLRVRGKDAPFHATAFPDDPPVVQPALLDFLSNFPQDAPYYGIRLDAEKKPHPDDLARAARETVMVEART